MLQARLQCCGHQQHLHAEEEDVSAMAWHVTLSFMGLAEDFGLQLDIASGSTLSRRPSSLVLSSKA